MTEDKTVGWFTNSINMRLSKLEIVKDGEARHAAASGVAKNWTQLSN